ncbi:MAG: metallophosphoesterase [Desulfatibacillum sp.]|nr:metallophosphoesterase [Desulfatibacillum sp.]
MFFTKLLIIWTIFHFYVFWRLSSIPFISKRLSRVAILLIMAFVWGSFLAGHTLDRMDAGGWAYPLEVFGANWMGVLLLLALCFGVADILTGFGLWLKHRLPAIRTAALVAACLLSAVALVQGMRGPVINSYEVTMPGLPAEADGLTAVVITDTHLGSIIGSTWMEARAEQIAALKPDIILAVGDIIEGHGAHEWENIPALKKLSAPLGVWAVNGNHENHGGAGSGFLEAAGMKMLHNQWKEARPGLIVAGVNDWGGYDERTSFPDVERALAGIPKNKAVIFLSHRPDGALTAARAGADLMLSGHTHGGQIWPFSYLTQWKYPLFAGRYQIEDMTAVVSRGAGTWGPRMRLWHPGEILNITLRSSKTN